MIDLDTFGLSLTELGFEPFDQTRPLPTGYIDRPRWRSRQWWETSDAESFFQNRPEFTSANDRASHLVESMARPVLDRLGAGPDDDVLEYEGRKVSLNYLLSVVNHDVADDMIDFADEL